MTVNLCAPDTNRSYAIAAHWLELLALSRSSGVSSSIDLNEAADILFDPASEDKSVFKSDDLDILNVETEAAMDAVFDEVGFRVDCLGKKYPFRVSFEDRRLRMERIEPSDDLALNLAHDIYETCLLMSCVRFGLLDAKKAGVSVEAIGRHFQILATAAAAGYVGGDAYLFGHPRPDETSMLDAVQKLSKLLRAGSPVDIPVHLVCRSQRKTVALTLWLGGIMLIKGRQRRCYLDNARPDGIGPANRSPDMQKSFGIILAALYPNTGCQRYLCRFRFMLKRSELMDCALKLIAQHTIWLKKAAWVS